MPKYNRYCTRQAVTAIVKCGSRYYYIELFVGLQLAVWPCGRLAVWPCSRVQWPYAVCVHCAYHISNKHVNRAQSLFPSSAYNSEAGYIHTDTTNKSNAIENAAFMQSAWIYLFSLSG